MSENPMLPLMDRLRAWRPGADGTLLADLKMAPANTHGKNPGAELALVFRLLGRNLDRVRAEELRSELAARVIGLRAEQEDASASKSLWPWSDVSKALSELSGKTEDTGREVSQRWSGIAALAAPRVGALEWLATALSLFMREHWVPAAVELAKLCASPLVEEPVLKELRSECEAIGLKVGGKRKWPRRHLLVLAAVTAHCNGGEFAGGSWQEWVRLAEGDLHDLSALADALLVGGHRDQARDCLLVCCQRFPKRLNYQGFESLRNAVEVLGESTPEEFWTVLLSGPPDQMLESLAGNYHDAVDTLRWLRRRGDAGREAELLQGRLAAAPGVAAAVNVSVADWLSRTRLAFALLGPNTWRAMPKPAQAAVFVELLVLLEHDCCRDIPWGEVLTAAGVDWLDAGHGGSVQEEFAASLCKLASERDVLFDWLIHSDNLSLEQILRNRWRRDGADGETWLVQQQVTHHAASHVVRRVMKAEGDPKTMACIVLEVIAHDAPGWETEKAHGVKTGDHLWQRVAEILPLTDWAARLRGAPGATEPSGLEVLIAMEKERFPSPRQKGAQPQLKPAEEWRVRWDFRLERCQRENEAILHYFRESPLEQREELLKALDECTKLVREVVIAEPRQHDSGGGVRWFYSAGDKNDQKLESPLNTPEQFQKWWGRYLEKTAQGFCHAANTIDRILTGEEANPRVQHRKDALDRVQAVSKEAVLNVACPILSPKMADAWVEALKNLRFLAEPLPWHVEATLDGCIFACELWIKEARSRHARHLELEEALGEGTDDGLEDEVERVLALSGSVSAAGKDSSRSWNTVDLLDTKQLERVGAFYLDRLDFRSAGKVRKCLRGRAGRVPSPLVHYWPFFSGIVVAPLQTLGTDKIWGPVLGSVAKTRGSLSFWGLCGFLLVISIGALLFDGRRRLPDCSWNNFLRRALPPLGIILAINYLFNWVIYLLSSTEIKEDPGVAFTVLLWGSISLYLGLVIGMIAQKYGGGREQS